VGKHNRAIKLIQGLQAWRQPHIQHYGFLAILEEPLASVTPVPSDCQMKWAPNQQRGVGKFWGKRQALPPNSEVRDPNEGCQISSMQHQWHSFIVLWVFEAFITQVEISKHVQTDSENARKRVENACCGSPRGAVCVRKTKVLCLA
jgi:hypothetical protein